MSEESQGQRAPMAGWKKMLLVLAAILVVAGLGMQAVALTTGDRSEDEAATSGGDDGGEGGGGGGGVADGLVSEFGPGDLGLPTGDDDDDDPGDDEDGEASPLAEWSPAIFRLGFGFFVGFAIAMALRAFLKITLIVAGVILLALFGLQYAGLVDVDWSAMEGRYDVAMDWLKTQTASFVKFVQGYVPSAVSTGLGAIVGWRK